MKARFQWEVGMKYENYVVKRFCQGGKHDDGISRNGYGESNGRY